MKLIGIINAWHRWDVAIITGQMDFNSFLNPCLFSEELLDAIKEYSLIGALVPVLWTGVDSLN